jgi:SPP1 family predicted phage head-tail adaptor
MATPRAPLSSRLRERITIRRPSRVREKGGYTKTWTTVAEVAAEVVSQNGREAVIAGALQGVTSYRITIRRRTDVKDGDQILYRPKGAAEVQELNITAPPTDDPFNPRDATVIYATTETATQGAAAAG